MPRIHLHRAIVLLLWLASFSSQASAARLIVGQAQRLVATDPTDFKTFGKTVAVEGDTAVVGAQGDEQLGEGAGAVYVFVRSGGGWQPHPLTPKLISSSGTDQVGFGQSVALSGTALIVGAELRSNTAGTAYIFRRATSAASSAWTQEQQLTVTGAVSSDLIAVSVAISGDTALLGAPGDNGTTGAEGAAYVFFRSASSTPLWGLQDVSPSACTPRPCRCTSGTCKLVATPRVANGAFGHSVAIDGNSVLVGAPAQGDEGAVFAFQQTSGLWDAGTALTVTAVIGPPTTGDGFGWSVALSGSWALVGAPRTNVNFIADAGAVFFFERTNAWLPRQRVNTPVPAETGEFGNGVAMSGVRAAVGAPGENSERGFLHLFSREPTSWRRTQPPVSSGGVTNTGFAGEVAVSADALLTGTTQEPCISGVCAEQGAAYIFSMTDAPAVPLMSAGALAALGGLLGLVGARRARRQRAPALLAQG